MRAGAWRRVSTGGQDEANQVPDIERHCTSREHRIVKWYTLHDKSASKGEQQAMLDEVLEDMRTGVIQVLVCWHSWRLERRGPRYIFNLLGDVLDAGGRIESVQEPEFGKLGDFGADAVTALTAIMGQQFSMTMREHTRLAHDRIDENGAFRGKVPFGLKVTGAKYHKRLEPTELGREWVPQIFERIIDGMSLAEVCWWLDAARIWTWPHDIYDRDTDTIKHRAGDPRPWWPVTVMQLVRNPVYVGHYSANDGRWVHECEALVDVSTFVRANEALRDRRRRQRGPIGLPENRAMLRGAIKCPDCGRENSMHKNQSPNTRTSREGIEIPAYYRCRSRGPDQQGCGNYVRMELVDAKVNQIIAEHFRKPIMLRVLVRGRDYQAELARVAMELRQLPAQGLDRAAEQAERERLWAEEDHYRAMPVEEDRWEEVPTGELYSEVYARTPIPERGAWLVKHRFRVYASKAGVTVKLGDEPPIAEPLEGSSLGV